MRRERETGADFELGAGFFKSGSFVPFSPVATGEGLMGFGERSNTSCASGSSMTTEREQGWGQRKVFRKLFVMAQTRNEKVDT